jgi:hypothetical protein
VPDTQVVFLFFNSPQFQVYGGARLGLKGQLYLGPAHPHDGAAYGAAASKIEGAGQSQQQ